MNNITVEMRKYKADEMIGLEEYLLDKIVSKKDENPICSGINMIESADKIIENYFKGDSKKSIKINTTKCVEFCFILEQKEMNNEEANDCLSACLDYISQKYGKNNMIRAIYCQPDEEYKYPHSLYYFVPITEDGLHINTRNIFYIVNYKIIEKELVYLIGNKFGLAVRQISGDKPGNKVIIYSNKKYTYVEYSDDEHSENKQEIIEDFETFERNISEKSEEMIKNTIVETKITSCFYSAAEVAQLLGISAGQTHQLMREWNKELEAKHYLVIAGKIPKQYLNEKIYGGVQAESEDNIDFLSAKEEKRKL